MVFCFCGVLFVGKCLYVGDVIWVFVDDFGEGDVSEVLEE